VLASEPERELRFYVIGGPIYGTDGSELSSSGLRGIVRELGLEAHVGLVPFQLDVARVYRDLDIVVHASTRPEPFGRTIVEAMSSGRPVVVARAGGATELFEDGVTGLGFTPGSVDELHRKILALVRDGGLRASLGTAGRASALSRFDRSRLGGEILAVYRELVGSVA
jgi:glycosyltransferase involved in cell wall biosynthesis